MHASVLAVQRELHYDSHFQYQLVGAYHRLCIN